MRILKNILSSIFLYKEPLNNYEFSISESHNENNTNESIYNEPLPDKSDEQTIYSSLDINIDYIKAKYNALINSDIILREFKLNIKGKQYNALLLFIDGMINSNSINDFILKPLMPIKENNSNKKSIGVINNVTVKK